MRAPTTAPHSSVQEANAALKGAYRTIGWVTWAYRLGALAYAVAAGFAILSLADPSVPRVGGLLVVGATTLLAALMAMGAIQILFHPFRWTLVIAVVASLVTVVHLVGPNPYGVAFLGSAAWAVVAWAALVPTLRFRRLVDEHRDLYVLHHASAETRRSLKDRTPHERHERLMRALRRAGTRAWKVSAVAAGTLVLLSASGSSVVLSKLRPPELAEALAVFETAWNRSDLDAAIDTIDPVNRETERTWLVGLAEASGWGEILPQLGERELVQQPTRATASYVVDGVPLRAHWVLAGRRWRLEDVELPTPSLEPVLEEFRTAWRASDPEKLLRFFSGEARARLGDAVRASFAARSWTWYPPIVDTRASDWSEGGSTVTFDLDEEGELETRWALRPDARWGLVELRVPPR